MRTLVLFLAAFTAAAAEVPLSAPVYGPAPANQLSAAVATDGTDYLVVWTDQRSLPHEAYATRVTSEGVVLDPTGIRIPAKNIYDAEVVWTGSSYLVVWSESGRVSSTRIDRDGHIVQEPRVLLDDAQLPHVIQAGDFTVIGHISGTSFPPSPKAAFVDENGNVVSRVTLGSPGVDFGSARVAWNGSQLVAVWTSGGLASSAITVIGRRFDITGPVGAPRVILNTGYNVDPQVASDGRDFLLVTRDYDTSIHRSTRFDAELTPGETFTLPPEIYSNATVLWTGTQYIVTGEFGSRVSAVLVDRDGRAVGASEAIEIATGPISPASAAAANGNDLFFAWAAAEDALHPFDSLDVYGAIVSAPSLQRETTALLSVAAARQSDPLVAASASNLLTLWNEKSGLYARRTDFDGRPLDAMPLRLGPASRSAVVFDGANFIVASIEDAPQQLVTRRIPATGALTARVGSTVPLASYVGSIALAVDAGETLLAWNTAEHVLASRLAADASLRDPVPLEIKEGVAGDLAAAGSGGGGFLVTWADFEIVCCHGQAVPIGISGARISRELTSLDAGGFTITNTNAYESDPSVTWNGREWLVTWRSEGLGGVSEVRARRVTRAGGLFEEWLIAAQAWNARVAWDGHRYVAAWFELPYPERPLRIYTAWIGADGEVFPPHILGEAEAFAAGGLVGLAPIAKGRIVTTYARLAREPLYGGVSRAFLQSLTFASRRRSVR